MSKYILVVLIMGSLLFQSCDNKHDDYNSIIGEWIMEDNGDVSYYRRYNISIERVIADTTLFAINNFYRTGNTKQLRVEVDGLNVLIRSQLVGQYIIQGSGIVDANFKEMNLEYDVRGGEVGFEHVVSTLKRE